MHKTVRLSGNMFNCFQRFKTMQNFAHTGCTLTHWSWYWGSLLGKNWLILNTISTIPLPSFSIRITAWKIRNKKEKEKERKNTSMNQLQLGNAIKTEFTCLLKEINSTTTHFHTMVFRPNMIFMCLMGATSLGRSLYVSSRKPITLSKCSMFLFFMMEYTWKEATRSLHESSRLRGWESISSQVEGSTSVENQHEVTSCLSCNLSLQLNVAINFKRVTC